MSGQAFIWQSIERNSFIFACLFYQIKLFKTKKKKKKKNELGVPCCTLR
jgi:hypothetical protein